MSRDLNKICVTFPSPILDMIIVCFIYFDNSLFAGLIFGRYMVIFPCQNFLFSNVRMKKSQFQVGKNFEKIVVLSSKLCLKLFVYLFPFTFLPTVGISVGWGKDWGERKVIMYKGTPAKCFFSVLT